MEQSNSLEEIRFWEHPPKSGIAQTEEKNKEISQKNQTGLHHHLRLIARWWWSKKGFLVHFRKLHLPSSRWTESQTVRAERWIISNSTTIHLRGQDYKYDLGCDAWTPHRRLLECGRGPRSIRFVDGFHMVHQFECKTSTWRRLTKKQTTSRPDFLWPEIWIDVSEAAQRKEKQKVADWKIEAWQCKKVAGYLLHRSSRCGVQGN